MFSNRRIEQFGAIFIEFIKKKVEAKLKLFKVTEFFGNTIVFECLEIIHGNY